jgi:hypothetical protein
LTAGNILDTVSLNGTATTNFDPVTGLVRIKPSGADIAVTHTTKSGSTFNSYQRAGIATTVLTLTTTNQNYVLPVVLQANDRLEVQHDFAGSTTEQCSLEFRVVPGTTQRDFPWDSGLAVHATFPATLTNTIQLRASAATSTPRITRIAVYRDAANALVVPAAHIILVPRAIGGSIANTGYDDIEIPYQIPLAPGDVLDTVTLNGVATTAFTANTGIVRIKPNGADIVVAHTTKKGGTYRSLQLLGEHRPAAAVDIEGANLVATGLNMQTASELRIICQHSSTGDFQSSGSVNPTYSTFSLDLRQLRGAANGYGWMATESGYCQVRIMDFAKGDLRFEDQNQGFQYVAAQVWDEAVNGFSIPLGTNIGTTYNVRVNGGTNGAFSGFEGIGPQSFFITGMTADQEVDAFPTIAGVTLMDRQKGMFSVDRASGGGDVDITGVTFRTMGVATEYNGTFSDQAGNAGHQFTQEFMSGNGITTSNNIDFTLRGGWYRVETGVTRHQGANAWRNTGLKVDGSAIETMYSGHDGGNWEGSGPIVRYVDATLASRVIQVYRVGSSNNGNANGYLNIKQVSRFVIPEGVQARTALVLTCNAGAVQLNGGANATVYAGTSQRIMVAVPAGQVLSTVATSGGCTATISDGRTGAVEVAVPLSTTGAQTLTVTFSTPSAARVITQANSAVAVAIGTIQVRMAPSGGNRSFQVTTNTGGNITYVYQSLASDGGAGIGVQSGTLTPGNWTYFSNRNFGGAGTYQNVSFNDQTNNRKYELRLEVGASYANNSYSLSEVL